MPIRVEPAPTFRDALRNQTGAAGRPPAGMSLCSTSPLVAELCAASRPACWRATFAAIVVDVFEPLNPALPAEPPEIVFPWASVIVIVVLLKVALT